LPRRLASKEKFRRQRALEQWAAELCESVEPSAHRIKPPTFSNNDLLAVYPMGDPHFGMYAWGLESGEDFDLKIAEKVTYQAIDRLVADAPAAREAIILELGDFFHSDNNSARTEASGHALDVDTRWARVMQIGLRAMVYVIKATLRKHQRVTVRIVQGNHDPHSSVFLATALDAYFRKEKRVRVDLSPAPFWFYRFGKVLIGATHGHTCKPQALPGIMATDRPEDWGATEFRVFHRGHVHHDDEKEYPGCKVQSHETLAAKDAWHAGAGYRSGRSMKCMVYHRKYGERFRVTCPVQMIQGSKHGRSRAAKSRNA
jgi:hypothetical protein